MPLRKILFLSWDHQRYCYSSWCLFCIDYIVSVVTLFLKGNWNNEVVYKCYVYVCRNTSIFTNMWSFFFFYWEIYRIMVTYYIIIYTERYWFVIPWNLLFWDGCQNVYRIRINFFVYIIFVVIIVITDHQSNAILLIVHVAKWRHTVS